MFKAAQVEGYEPATPRRDHEPIEQGERLVEGWKASGMQIREGAAAAYYSPSTDVVHLPTRDAFRLLDHFYSVAAHEASHWTAPRVGRALGGRFAAPSTWIGARSSSRMFVANCPSSSGDRCSFEIVFAVGEVPLCCA